MKIKYRQKTMGWCSVYLLANVFNNCDFLRYTQNEGYKGCGDKEIDQMLSELKYGLKLSGVFYANQHYARLPKRFIYSSLLAHDEGLDNDDVEIPITPYFLTVRLIESIWHHVAILIWNKRMFYIDPYKEDVIEITSFEHFNVLFIDCHAVDRPYIIETEKYAVLKGEVLQYEFLNELELVE